MEYSFIISSLLKLEQDAKTLRLAVEQMAGQPTAPSDFTAEPKEQFREGQRVQTSDSRDPLAKSMSDLVTPKQLGMIRALARECHLDADAECRSFLGCKTEDLSKRAASSFIDHLKATQDELARPRRAS